jgi:hypothetical protein
MAQRVGEKFLEHHAVDLLQVRIRTKLPDLVDENDIAPVRS